MKGSHARIKHVLEGRKPDRIPLFDLLPNDAILKHFNRGQPVAPGDDESAIHAIAEATDGTRNAYFSPLMERTVVLPTGQTQKFERWTIWTADRTFSSSEEYRQVKLKECPNPQELAGNPFDTSADPNYQRQRHIRNLFGEDYFYFTSAINPGIMSIFGEVGLEAFSEYLYECEEIIDLQLEVNTLSTLRWIKGLPKDDPFEGVFLGDDMAFKSGTLVNPRWMRLHYFPRLRRVIEAWHNAGKKVMFHSDGNLNEVMDDLVELGIDLLNPIETAAGMDLADLHRRYPNLIFAGGIDVSTLLPFGTRRQIKDAVVKAIEDTEGKILVGSSTEVFNIVPLENYLALREAVLDFNL